MVRDTLKILSHKWGSYVGGEELDIAFSSPIIIFRVDVNVVELKNLDIKVNGNIISINPRLAKGLFRVKAFFVVCFPQDVSHQDLLNFFPNIQISHNEKGVVFWIYLGGEIEEGEIKDYPPYLKYVIINWGNVEVDLPL